MPSEKCACGCCHVPDHGACPTFEASMSAKHCVYCDHGPQCHPGKGKHFNTPLGIGTTKEADEYGPPGVDDWN